MTLSAGRPDVLVGVDVGTTRVKAAVVNLSGAELASAGAETPWVVHGSHVEMNAVDLIGTVRTVIAEALDQHADDHVIGVGVTSVGESGVLIDEHGDPAAPVVAWYDQRGDVELIAKELPELVARTGVRFDPVATIFKLPELLRRGDAARWLSLAEWVVRQLGGDEVAEMSLAGRTGLCDLHTGTVVARRPRVPGRR